MKLTIVFLGLIVTISAAPRSHKGSDVRAKRGLFDEQFALGKVVQAPAIGASAPAQGATVYSPGGVAYGPEGAVSPSQGTVSYAPAQGSVAYAPGAVAPAQGSTIGLQTVKELSAIKAKNLMQAANVAASGANQFSRTPLGAGPAEIIKAPLSFGGIF